MHYHNTSALETLNNLEGSLSRFKSYIFKIVASELLELPLSCFCTHKGTLYEYNQRYIHKDDIPGMAPITRSISIFSQGREITFEPQRDRDLNIRIGNKVIFSTFNLNFSDKNNLKILQLLTQVFAKIEDCLSSAIKGYSHFKVKSTPELSQTPTSFPQSAKLQSQEIIDLLSSLLEK